MRDSKAPSYRRSVKTVAERVLVWPALCLAALLPASLAAFVDGPPPASTGGFGEPNCLKCHFDAPVNQPPGALTLHGMPTLFEPEERYDLTVVLSRPGLAHGGFQIAVRHAEGELAGTQAGRLTAKDGAVQIVQSGARGAVDYAEQTTSGARANKTGELAWNVEWKTPRNAGPVLVHLAANASNDDESPLGDEVYLLEVRSVPATRPGDSTGPRPRAVPTSTE